MKIKLGTSVVVTRNQQRPGKLVDVVIVDVVLLLLWLIRIVKVVFVVLVVRNEIG
ncbi:hypothetical protein TanjilG_29342 [Lupinus angustifolius]|uniref:Uncharacterized protein n=1 Tax=Lupinus angustifolius TaxID=3871 RepID=A0A1J7HNQ9_LUPAN|nr:hypothetical protein TanjilG_29342 [Lupinus angustifolius]